MSVRDQRGDEADGPTIWTVEAVRQLGMTTDIETAAAILGIGRTLAFELSKADQFPVRLLRVGRRVLVPIPDLLRLLGATPGDYDRCMIESRALCVAWGDGRATWVRSLAC
jgi:hypothetical protein